MSIRNLNFLFKPRSVAVIGASNRRRSVGATVMRNLLDGGFDGPIMPVNPRYKAVAGVLTYPDIQALPEAPELAVIATPPAMIPQAIAALGERGARAAVVLTAGLDKTLVQAMLAAARPHLLRILGPNCVGLIVPGLGLNASFAHTRALGGDIAFVSQSGGLTTVVLDWARTNGIGFSHFISLGDGADVDFGDVLDWLGGDPDTRAILLYIESVRQARKFMSAARAAARNKPVLAVKAGRVPEGARAAASHTGALAGSDAVYDAAIRRAGMLRVTTVEDLFAAVQTLARAKSLSGDRLAIMTNGGGPGVMATDALVQAGGRLAQLSDATVAELDELLPATWSRGNPVDIIGDAPAERYVNALEVLLEDDGSDAVLLLHVPTAIVPSGEIAEAVVEVIQEASRNVLTCWLGGEAVAEARQCFARAGVPTYDTPEEAVRAFLQMGEYRRNQEQLMETPAAGPAQSAPDRAAARAAIDAALAAGREWLDESQARQVLAA
ncbi:MAG: CoA-binding protein, partial [Pseudomonadota bacterium]|nr:CoA-binding protein [Pseudomonadota bacterium]